MEVRGSDHSLVRSGDRNGLSGLMPATSELNITHTLLSPLSGHMLCQCIENDSAENMLKKLNYK